MNKIETQIQNQRWKRFMKFVKWYMKQGGMPLSAEEIERTLVKF